MRLYEAGLPGTGQSAGESRIFRHAHDDPRLVAFACESRGVWDGWAEHFDVELISSDGVVAIGDSALERLRVLDQVGGVEAREIDAAEVAQRMPLLAGYAGPAVLDELGGAIRTRTVIEALAGALAHAVTTGEVISIDPRADGTVEVRSVMDRAVYSKVVVCAGRETARLARSVGLLPVRLAAHVRLTFDVKASPRHESRACRTVAASSAKSASTRRRYRATAAIRSDSAKPSASAMTELSSTLRRFDRWTNEHANT